MSLQSGAREDARYERDHGGALPAAEARARAASRAAEGREQSANYWSAYAAEVESWEWDSLSADPVWVREARYLGHDAGLAAASWVMMGEDDAESILSDVDPEVMDRYRGPNLSGEMAGESIPEVFDGFPDPWDEEVHQAWEDAAGAAFSTALQGVALRVLGRVDDATAVERELEATADRLRREAREEDR